MLYSVAYAVSRSLSLSILFESLLEELNLFQIRSGQSLYQNQKHIKLLLVTIKVT